MEILRWKMRYKDGVRHSTWASVWGEIKLFLRSAFKHPIKSSGRILRDPLKWAKAEYANRNWKALWSLTWWYWLTSGYGERADRAAVCLLVIIFSFACLYTFVGFVPPDNQGMGWSRALIYSFEVAILQKPDPRPLTSMAHLLVGLETVLGPLQGTLLALAIRRKFMR